nr:MAG TPA: hypothetical protein [Caudoviricetes sp.]
MAVGKILPPLKNVGTIIICEYGKMGVGISRKGEKRVKTW